MGIDISELRAERDHLLRTNKDILDRVDKDDRTMSEDEKNDINANLAESEKLEGRIAEAEAQEELRSRVSASLEENTKPLQRRGAPLASTNGEMPSENRPSISMSRSASLKAFSSEQAAYRSGQWIRAMFLGDKRASRYCRDHGVFSSIEAIAATRAHSEGVNSAGGALVPEEFSQTVIDLREKYGIFRQNCKVVPMGRDTMQVPRRTGGLTAYWGEENTAISDSQKSWNNITLTAKKLGTLAYVSSELAEDAIIDIAEDLAMESAYAFAQKEDQTGFIGDGTSTYNGIQGIVTALNTSSLAGHVEAAAGVDTFAEVTAADISKAMGVLPEYARMNAKFYCSQTAHDAIFQRIAISAGGNTIQSISGKFQPSFAGYPIVVSQTLPSSTSTIDGSALFLFGDLSLAASLGDRREFRFRSSEDYKFAEDQIAFKATERVDINVHDYGDDSDAGPMVALIGKTS